jgi:arylsulfatase A-like enzyme/thioredoxin-like negative regulator of GroEL
MPLCGDGRLGRHALALLSIPLTLLACHSREPIAPTAHAPVILISIDTLRADHLPMFGYKGVETPNLDALRRDGILFTNAFSHVPLTLPSHASVLTGQLPTTNGVRNNIGYELRAGTPTIASMLHDDGYATGAAVSAYVLRGSTGVRATFDFYEDSIENQPGIPTGSLQRPGNLTAAIAKQWIEQHGTKPFFFFLHLFEPHSPYEPPEPLRSRYAASPYDGEIAAADAIVGDFIGDLKSRGIYDRAIIILFSDHGEGLSQHGETEHGIFLYREAIHVPLLVKLPSSARAGEADANPVGLVDILPTIAELTGATAPPKLDGVSLLAPKTERRIYSETLYPRIHLGWSELRSLEDAQHHFIQAPRPELYDMSADPAETRNILSEERRTYSAMKAELERYNAAVVLPTHVDPEEAKKLAALGYLGSTATATSGPLPDPKDRIGEIADMTRAVTLAHQGHEEEAIALFHTIVSKNPKLTDAWNELGLTLERLGRYEDASEAYRTAIEKSPELAGEFALSRASMLLKLGRYDEALKHADLGARTNPAVAHLLRARVALAQRDARTAETEARAARNAAGNVVLAQALAEQGRLPEALQVLDATEATESRESVRGDVLARMERYPEAVTAFRANIAAYPRDLSAYAKLAIVHVLQNRPADARAVLDEMLRKNTTREAREMAAKTRRELGI